MDSLDCFGHCVHLQISFPSSANQTCSRGSRAASLATGRRHLGPCMAWEDHSKEQHTHTLYIPKKREIYSHGSKSKSYPTMVIGFDPTAIYIYIYGCCVPSWLVQCCILQHCLTKCTYFTLVRQQHCFQHPPHVQPTSSITSKSRALASYIFSSTSSSPAR